MCEHQTKLYSYSSVVTPVSQEVKLNVVALYENTSQKYYSGEIHGRVVYNIEFKTNQFRFLFRSL